MNSRIFLFFLGLIAFGLVMTAAVFSITGLAMLYDSSYHIIVAMSIIESSKIIIASLLYRYWKSLLIWLKTYLVIALIILMIITSGGIYGFMTYKYQNVTISLDKINSEMILLEDQEKLLAEDRDRFISDRQKLLEIRNQDISGVIITDSTRYYDSRIRQRAYERYESELLNINRNLDSTNIQLNRIRVKIAGNKTEMIDTGVEVGPLVYMSRVFNTSMDNVMNWFSLLIILVFDPLAVVLVIAFNFVLIKIKEEKIMYSKEIERQKEIERRQQERERTEKEKQKKLEDIQKQKEEQEKRTISIDFKDVVKKITNPIVQSETLQKPIILKKKKNDLQDNLNTVKKIENKITDDEILNSFEDASRKIKLSDNNKQVIYEPGGNVDIDYSIQED